jgi:hypothetical protein
MRDDDFMTRAERFAREGPRGEAWICESALWRWVYIVVCLFLAYPMFVGFLIPLPNAGIGWMMIDAMGLLMTLNLVVHAWMAWSRKVCLLPCNAFHPNWQKSMESSDVSDD